VKATSLSLYPNARAKAHPKRNQKEKENVCQSRSQLRTSIALLEVSIDVVVEPEKATITAMRGTRRAEVGGLLLGP
jgi:hypothetical protein